jgi:dihydrofolate reductase
MRKLKLQVQLSADGFNSRPDGALDWMTWGWDNRLKSFVNELHDPVDTILLGRKMTEGFVGHWEKVTTTPEDESYGFAMKMVETPKIVFSRTATTTPGKNTTIVNGDLKEEVNNLKQQDGGDMIVYGGTELVSNLIKEDLIDEYNLFINPAAIGTGGSIFAKVNGKHDLKLKRSIGFDCGIVLLQYERK